MVNRGEKDPEPIVIKDTTTRYLPALEIPLTLKKALEYLKGYCNKHPFCDHCKLYHDDGCVFYNKVPPVDWDVEKMLQEKDVEADGKNDLHDTDSDMRSSTDCCGDPDGTLRKEIEE